MGDVVKLERCAHSIIDKDGRKLVCIRRRHPKGEIHNLRLSAVLGDRPPSQGTVPQG